MIVLSIGEPAGVVHVLAAAGQLDQDERAVIGFRAERVFGQGRSVVVHERSPGSLERMGIGHARGYRWGKFAAFVTQHYGGICWICGHQGAAQVDHVIPVTEGGAEWDLANCRPAHGISRRPNPCPVCSPEAGRPIFCNQIRGGLSVERARRIIAERVGSGNPPGTGNARPGARPKPDAGAGREW